MTGCYCIGQQLWQNIAIIAESPVGSPKEQELGIRSSEIKNMKNSVEELEHKDKEVL